MKSNYDNPTILGVALAGVVAVAVAPEAWDSSDSVVGLVLLLVLLAYGDYRPETLNSRRERWALSAVLGLCLVLAVGPVIPLLHDIIWPSETLAFATTWILAVAIVYSVLPKASKRWLNR